MQIVKITNANGVFYSDNVDEHGDLVGAEIIEMTEDEYRSIPTTSEAQVLFGEGVRKT